MTKVRNRIGAVILTYNSSQDLPDCIIGLQAQSGVDLRIIIVDNASNRDERARMEGIFRKAMPEGRILSAKEPLCANASDVFLRNDVNSGYSAGNNIGARAAIDMGCSAVLIINPDVQIKNPNYVANLAEQIHENRNTAILCSRLTNLSGQQENPMKELNFWEEALWPIFMLNKALRKKILERKITEETTFPVEKVSGACFMIRSDILQKMCFFDEAVFLYCEESILMKQVKNLGYHMLMDPRIEAIHAHRSETKSDPLPRYKQWLLSRKYFHRRYSNHGLIKYFILAISRSASIQLMRFKLLIKRNT